MRVIPEDHPSKLPPETLFEQASPEDLSEPFRKVTRVPERPLPFRSLSKPSRSSAECLLSKLLSKPPPDRPSESATCPGSQPRGHPPLKAPFDTPSNQTLRNAFGTRHVSRRLSRKSPSKTALCPRS